MCLNSFFWSYGAVIASLVAEFAVTLTMYLLIRNEIEIKNIFKTCVKPLLASIIMFFVIYFIQNKLSPSILHTFILVTIGGIIYSFYLY